MPQNDTEHVIFVDSATRDTTLYPNANSYVTYLTTPLRNISRVELVSAMLPSLSTSTYLTLDITELRTPTHQNTNKILTKSAGSGVTSLTTSSGANGSFATLPVKVSGTTEFYGQNYLIKVEFPARIDSLDKLTINWTYPDGSGIASSTLGAHQFLLRFHCVLVPETPERPESLPEPVEWKENSQKEFYILALIMIAGLILIIMSRKKSQ